MGKDADETASPDDISIQLLDRPLVPEGRYEAVYLHHETARSFGRASKVYVWFRVTSLGDSYGVKLYKAYNVKSLKGKPRRGGGFVVGRHHSLLSDLIRVLGLKLRPDRISFLVLVSQVVEVSVRTVTTNYRQEPLAEFLRYSVIDRLERIAT